MVVDDHPIVRRGIRDALAAEGCFEIVAEAADAETALAKASSLAPDLATVDLSLGRSSGLELIRRLRALLPSMKLLVVSVHDEDLYAERALRAGADGYVGKSEPADRLVAAVRQALAGRTALSTAITQRLVQQAVHGSAAAPAGVESLSDRELEVFRLIGSGLGTRQIAGQLGISVKTVETHRENIKRKLEIGSAPELARFAVAWVEDCA